MKTRQEMIYDFMVALAPSLNAELASLVNWYKSEDGDPDVFKDELSDIYARAEALADACLGGVQ